MPELPEVETTVRGLKSKILGRKIKDVWIDFEKMVKKPKNFKEFKRKLKGKEIKNIKRRGKNILINLSNNKILLIHQKMTGHLLFGEWVFKKGKWFSEVSGPLRNDFKNQFLHLIFFLDNGKNLALSDLRKFAKVELWDENELENSKGFKDLGPEPLEKKFTFVKFKGVLGKRKKGKIKQVLMDQKIIAGIGNIYSDEILWEAQINPFRDIKTLKEKELKKIYKSMRKILKKGIKVKGDSVSDYRRIDGTKGDFGSLEKVYRKEGKKCRRCGSIIKRKKIGGRSTHFCPKCQK
ncbi:MAG: DNA-formamidopyrimidine glycosylase [Candidatus Nealsonbacteria bacterium]